MHVQSVLLHGIVNGFTLQDDEYLEEEKNFLASLRNSGRLTLMELESSYS